jgi:glycosyltransferase involved in cell wall biosynthesis
LASLSSGKRSWASFNILVVSPTPTHPQDHGNRKRIFEICAELKRRGARIEFVHYPGEHDWRDRWPKRREEEMRAAWDAYHLVPPSRGLHEAARNGDHEIDEWADPSLTAFVAWACRARAYDVVLVNYTWMSFCLEAVPGEVFRICDTHDVFSGRRQLLEANGIDAEFFHTTKAEEARGLARADLVWAIKPSEAAYFRDDLGVRDCLTVLHAEPERGWWTGPPSKDGWLRAGVIGAKNSINKRNLEAFLTEALPVFEAYMAPVKIIVAGGLSDEFRSWSHPNLEVIGRVDEVETFYSQVDVVVAPIRFSTGLKIKVSEALASGAPLVAHAHAMEGYPTKEPLHRLHTFPDIALELAKLSFDRAPLADLAKRSHSVCRAVAKSVSASLDETQRRLVSTLASTICFVVPAEAFDPANLLHDHLLAALDYLRQGSRLAIFARGEPPRRMNFDFLRRYDLPAQVFVDPELADALGEEAPDFWTSFPLAELLEVRGFSRIYLMADCGDDLLMSVGALRQVIVRHDAIEIAGGDADGVVENLRSVEDLVLVSDDPNHLGRWTEVSGIAEIVGVPFRRNGPFESLQRRVAGPRPRPLLVLARPGDPVAEELLRMAAGLGWNGVMLDPGDPLSREALLGRGPPESEDPLARFSELRLLVDMTEDDAMAEIVGEAAIRAGTPRLCFLRGARAVGRHAFASPLKPASPGQLYSTVADCAAQPAVHEKLRKLATDEAETRYTNNAGWTILRGWLEPQDSGRVK